MRMKVAASLVAVCGMLAAVPARADWVPPFKGNDTGGIIAYSLTSQTDIRTLAINHCASYGKVVKFLAVEAALRRLHFLCLPLGTVCRDRSAAARPLLKRTVPSETCRERGT